MLSACKHKGSQALCTQGDKGMTACGMAQDPWHYQKAWVPAAAELDPAGESHAKEVTDEQVVQQLPEELRRQSLSGTLPVSLHTLRVRLCTSICIRRYLPSLFLHSDPACFSCHHTWQ